MVTQDKVFKENQELGEKVSRTDAILRARLDAAGLQSIDEGTIVSQIKREYDEGWDLVNNRRNEFRYRFKLYNNQKKQRDKIGITVLYNMMNALLARYYVDRLDVVFSGRFVGNEANGDYITQLAKYDYEEMGLDILDYQTQWDRLFFGVGVRVKGGWDNTTKTPMFNSVSPLSCIPDARGGANIDNYRYFGIEGGMQKWQMNNSKQFFNIELVASIFDTEDQQTESARRSAQGLGDPQEDTGASNPMYQMYNHFTIINGIKYLFTLSNDRSTINRVVRLKAITKDEKKDPTKISWPFVFNFYDDQRNTFLGVNVGDLVEDKQRAESVLANLRLSKEKAELYPMYLYDKDKVLNRNDLDFAFNKFIAVEGDPSGAIQVMQKDFNKGSTVSVQRDLRAESELSTGVSKNVAGTVNTEGRSATEIQKASNSADLRFLLSNKLNKWGEKRFWLLWYKTYQEFFSSADEKMIKINNTFLSSDEYLILGKDDFVGKTPLIITINTVSELESKKEKGRLFYSTFYNALLQNPNIPASSLNYGLRELGRVNNLSEEQIRVLVPYTADEVDAHNENALLSEDQEYVPINAEDDDLSHMLIHQAALDTASRELHIQSHKEQYLNKGKPVANDMNLTDKNVMRSQSNASQAAIANMTSKTLAGTATESFTG